MITVCALDTPITVRSNYQTRGTIKKIPMFRHLSNLRTVGTWYWYTYCTVHVWNTMQITPVPRLTSKGYSIIILMVFYCSPNTVIICYIMFECIQYKILYIDNIHKQILKWAFCSIIHNQQSLEDALDHRNFAIDIHYM